MIKYNEFGEVISVNGLTTGQHLGTEMQDACCQRPDDNDCYVTERNTINNIRTDNDFLQPSTGGSGGSSGGSGCNHSSAEGVGF